ncbi:MAG: LysM peptidoglycan-binding domain-containing protein [Spirochaetia bacterium]
MTAQVHGVLGIRTADGTIVEVLDFVKSAETVTIFTTTADRQKKAEFDLYFRDNPGERWVYLDALSLNWIPPARAGEPDLRIQARSDGKGNLMLGIDEPVSKKSEIFMVDAESLARHCRRLSTGSVSRPMPVQAASRPNAPASDNKRSRIEGSSAPQVGQGGRRRRFGWIALILLVPVLVLMVILIGPKLLSPEREAATTAGKDRVESTAEAESREPVFSSTSTPAPESRVQPLSNAPTTAAVEPRVHPGSVVEQSQPAQSVEQDWYRITWGDTLWRVAERFYGDRDLYPELAESNSLSDPDYIIAGETIRLPPAILGKARRTWEEERNE